MKAYMYHCTLLTIRCPKACQREVMKENKKSLLRLFPTYLAGGMTKELEKKSLICTLCAKYVGKQTQFCMFLLLSFVISFDVEIARVFGTLWLKV